MMDKLDFFGVSQLSSITIFLISSGFKIQTQCITAFLSMFSEFNTTTDFTSHIINDSNPLTNNLGLFLVQIMVIFVVNRFMGYISRYYHQPQAMAEVIGGIILGPTVLSRIPAFKDAIFPDDSLPRLQLFANFGLILYLYLIGLEIDTFKLVTHFKRTSMISIGAFVLPFISGTNF